MRLIGLRVQNYLSIVDSEEIRIEPFQALVGENNAGKSNLLKAIQVFLTSGAAGVNEANFYNNAEKIIITASFGGLSKYEKNRLRPYLIGDKLVLEKQLQLQQEDPKTGKIKINNQYHGYVAKPKDWWLSVESVIEHTGSNRPKWDEIAKEHGLLDYVTDDSGHVNKSSYETGIKKLLIEKEDIEFEEPTLGITQALGIQPALLVELPIFRILPAITDFSDEIDKRASQTNFRLLMGDLADRIIKYDPRYLQIEESIKQMRFLLNEPLTGEEREKGQERLGILKIVESKLKEIISHIMPSVCGIRINVEIEAIKDIFSRGVSILVNDGTFTEVLLKGHGMQRCVVFGLIQALILNQRGQLIDTTENIKDENGKDNRRIILGIEEPELYIHPQMQRLIYSLLRDFASSDQIIFSTHSPAFIDVAKYESIGVVRKDSVMIGTKVKQCTTGVLDEENERKTFQFISSFGLEQNKLFFAKKVVLVEGKEDVIALIATGRKLELFREFPEEIGYTIISTGSKQEFPKYEKLLNAFSIPFVLFHELDGEPESTINQHILSLLNGNKYVSVPNRLEDAVGHKDHFRKEYDAAMFFQKPENISVQFKNIVKELFT